jgi:flagellar export protein FliJ
VSRRFEFRLQRVLDLKRTLEADRAADVVDAQQQAAEQEALLAELERARLEVRRNLSRLGPSAAGLLSVMGDALEAHEGLVGEVTSQAREAQDRLEEALESYLLARSEARSLDRLRDKQKTQWSVESARTEQKLADEAAAQKHQQDHSNP